MKQTVSIKFGELTQRKYKNHRGEVTLRTFIPLRIEYGVTEHHKETQWFLHTFDMDKKDYRTFALNDFAMDE